LIRSLLLALGMTLVVTTRTPSQAAAATAGIMGRLVDQQTRAPVQGARVALLGTHHETGTDSAGRFVQAGLTPGAYFLEIRALGYGAGSWLVRVGPGETVDTVFELHPVGIELAPVVVAARPTLAQRRIQEFERRRHERHGVFITAEQIETNNATTLMDVLRNVPGVRIMCTTRGCQVRMTRSARGGGGGCQPDWVMDGLPATLSSTPSMSTVGIVGIEIYRSLSETPSEFLKSDSQCGVIAIWTKSGP
jgi:hypothetical protein